MGEETVREKQVFTPKKNLVIVKPIRRSRNPMVDDPAHENYFLFGNATNDYQLPMDRQGNLINPFESKEEQRWLEKELDVDLNIYKGKGNFWNTFKVKLGKTESRLNLGNPKDYLDYLVLKANKLFIAPTGEEQFDRATYRYALITPEFETKTKVKAIDRKVEAYKALGKLEDDREGMLNFLKVYGRKVDMNSKREFLVEQLNKIIEEDIEKFLDLYNDKENYEIRLLIAQAVEYGAVEKKGRKYTLPGGDPLCGAGDVPTIENAIKYLKSPANQDLLMNIEARINNAKD